MGKPHDVKSFAQTCPAKAAQRGRICFDRAGFETLKPLKNKKKQSGPVLAPRGLNYRARSSAASPCISPLEGSDDHLRCHDHRRNGPKGQF